MNQTRSLPVKKIVILSTGWILVIIGPVVGILPGPGGIAVTGVGALLIMGQSRIARRMFVRTQRRYPETIGPVRRFIRRRNQRRTLKRLQKQRARRQKETLKQGVPFQGEKTHAP